MVRECDVALWECDVEPAAAALLAWFLTAVAVPVAVAAATSVAVACSSDSE